MKWYFDTSVLVAAAVEQHPHNAPALAVLEELLRRKHRGFTSAQSLTEFYSVLTRTPFRPPFYPSEVWQIVEKMILPHFDLVTLTSREYQDVVRMAAANGWTGGRIHDVVHIRCAQKIQCDRIYTFNVKDFRALASAELQDKVRAP
ncbi:MAG: type II toxin-antitoxin system VapC family toxin [Bryobacteraceae bacterium]